jgi:hypothetical protein
METQAAGASWSSVQYRRMSKENDAVANRASLYLIPEGRENSFYSTSSCNMPCLLASKVSSAIVLTLSFSLIAVP